MAKCTKGEAESEWRTTSCTKVRRFAWSQWTEPKGSTKQNEMISISLRLESKEQIEKCLVISSECSAMQCYEGIRSKVTKVQSGRRSYRVTRGTERGGEVDCHRNED